MAEEPAGDNGADRAAVAGRVLTLDNQPLEGVTLRIDDKTTRTDSAGWFLLTPVSPGRHELFVDGRTVSGREETYGMFEIGVEVIAGRTNILPYAIWMPEIDTAHAVTLASPTISEVVLTTPHIPGLEIRIPPGTVITDADGQVVTQVSITPVPVERPPFPMPPVEFPIYFTVQSGGAYLSPGGARIIYPNSTNEAPGTRVDYWHYDPEEEGWYLYGQGTVTPDGQQIVPDPGITVYEFTGISFTTGGTPPERGPVPDGSGDGDPVDLGTGLFVLQKTDLFLPDTFPVALTRIYRNEDKISRSFGIGMSHPYALFPKWVRGFEEADVILPDGGRIRYTRVSGTGYETELEHTSTPTIFYKSRVKYNRPRAAWELTFKDGTVYVFGSGVPLQAIQDRNGNRVTILRTDANGNPSQKGNITHIRSPNGRWIAFTYDARNRVTQAVDNMGRVVTYTYDGNGRLSQVTDPNGGVTEYTYDASHRMLTIRDARGIVCLTNRVHFD